MQKILKLIAYPLIVVLRALLMPVALTLVIWLVWYIEKLQFELPLFRWLTFDEVLKLGYSKLACQAALPSMHHLEMLEVRVLPNLSDEQCKDVETYEFHPMTLECYEFRLITRGRRRKEKPDPNHPFAKWAPA